MRRFAYSVAVSGLMLAPTFAQEVVSVAPSGVETQVGWIGSVGENCVANPVPTVMPVEAAQNGQIRLTVGEVKTDSLPQCPGIRIPAIVVFYTSTQGYEGEDRFVLAVDSAGVAAQRAYTISVGANAPSRGADGTIPI